MTVNRCPFCGSPALPERMNAYGLWFVGCVFSRCAAQGPVHYERDWAVEAWNGLQLREIGARALGGGS